MGKAGRIAAGSAGAAILLLVLAQVLLPRIAASRISSRVGRYGSVESVHVTAWPALKLLWGNADSVKVRIAAVKVSPAQTAKLLREARGVDELLMTASRAQEGPLQLSDVKLVKRGTALHAEGRMTEQDVKAALPAGFGVRLLGSRGGEVEVRASGGLFGIGASVDAVALASDGELIAHPRGFLLEGLRLTLFADPHVYVLGVSASQTTDSGGAAVYDLAMTARLR